MPICYCFGDACYVHDVVFSNLDKTVTQPLVIAALKKHLPHVVQFEANNGGSEYCSTIDDNLRKDNIRLNLTSRKAPSNMNKIARIVQVAPEIKRMYFIAHDHAPEQYREFMRWLCTFTIVGKNEHDDAPDSLAMVVSAMKYNFGVVTISHSPI